MCVYPIKTAKQMQALLNELMLDVRSILEEFPVFYTVCAILVITGVSCTTFGIICNKYISCTTIDTYALLAFGIITLLVAVVYIVIPCLLGCVLNRIYPQEAIIYKNAVSGLVNPQRLPVDV